MQDLFYIYLKLTEQKSQKDQQVKTANNETPIVRAKSKSSCYPTKK